MTRGVGSTSSQLNLVIKLHSSMESPDTTIRADWCDNCGREPACRIGWQVSFVIRSGARIRCKRKSARQVASRD